MKETRYRVLKRGSGLALKGIKIGFIGAGNMAESLIKRLISLSVLPQKNLLASDINIDRLQYISKTYSIETLKSNKDLAKKADIVILAVKPQGMSKILAELYGVISKKQLVISIAAGITIEGIKSILGDTNIIRVMPNNPALVGEGISAISADASVGEKHIKLAETIFDSVGKTLRIEETLLDAVTALSGSGPGFVYYFLEAMIEGGESIGLSHEASRELAVQTFLGSIKTVIETGKSPEELRHMVTSPGGTTLAGLKVFETNNFKEIISKALVQAAKRAKELSEGLS